MLTISSTLNSGQTAFKSFCHWDRMNGMLCLNLFIHLGYEIIFFNEAKCNLGKVKLETMQYRTSGVAQGIWQGLPWLRLQMHFTPADLCGSFAIVLWRIIADSHSCCIMNC